MHNRNQIFLGKYHKRYRGIAIIGSIKYLIFKWSEIFILNEILLDKIQMKSLLLGVQWVLRECTSALSLVIARIPTYLASTCETSKFCTTFCNFMSIVTHWNFMSILPNYQRIFHQLFDANKSCTSFNAGILYVTYTVSW